MGAIIAPIAGAAGGVSGLGAASFLISTAGQVLGFVGQQQQAAAQFEAQQQAQRNQLEAQRQAAEQRNQALRLEQRTIQERQLQEQEQLDRRQFQESIRKQEAKATVKAEAAAGGVAGASVDVILQDFDFQQGLLNEAISRQQQFINQSTASQFDASNLQARSDLISINRPVAPAVQQSTSPFPIIPILGNAVDLFNIERRRQL